MHQEPAQQTLDQFHITPSSKGEEFHDKMIILGCGGGRYHAIKQDLSTGGYILQLLNGDVQIHVDPGPGAIRDIHHWKINPQKTSIILLTHAHLDHCMSVPIIIEAMQQDYKFKKPYGTLIAPLDYISERGLDLYHQKMLSTIITIEHVGESRTIHPKIDIVSTPTKHSPIMNFGYILKIKHEKKHYSIGITSDTFIFSELYEVFNGVDILIANLLRPDNLTTRVHMNTTQLINLLKEIKPKLCILLHFGGRMYYEGVDLREQEAKKIENSLNKETRVIPGKDGLRINFSDYIYCKE